MSLRKHFIPVFLSALILISSYIFVSCIYKKAPDDEKIKAEYIRAKEAYEWFEMKPMPTWESGAKEYNGCRYFKVKHDSIKTYKDFEDYLYGLFSPYIVDGLLDAAKESKQYIDLNGALYVLPADRGADITRGNETYEITRVNSKKVIFRVVVEIINPDTQKVTGYENNDFTYESLDGKWVFTKFSLVR